MTEKHRTQTELWDDWYNKQTDWDKEQIDLYMNEKYGFCLPEEVTCISNELT